MESIDQRIHSQSVPGKTAAIRRIEDKAAMNSCVGADVNGDHRPDLVCTGAGGAIRWYENKGPARGATAGR